MAQELLIAVHGDIQDNKTVTIELPRRDGTPPDRFTVTSMDVFEPLLQLLYAVKHGTRQEEAA